MKFLYILCVLFFSSLFTAAQSNFYKAYAQFFNNDPACMIQLPDSGYVIYSTDYNPDQELRRLDKHGNVIWHKKMLNSPGTERAGAITLSSKNHILIAGKINNDVNLFRLDLNGNTIFKKVYSGAGAGPNEIVEDAWGNIYIVGWYTEILKTDSTGTLKWKKSYQANYIESIIPVSANRTILVGSANSAVGVFTGSDIVHITIDSTGTVIKQKSFGTNAQDNTQDAFMDSSKKIFTSLLQIDYNTKDTAVGFLCTDTLGNQLWTRVVKGNFQSQSSGTLLKDNSLLCYAHETSGSNPVFALVHFSNDGKAIQYFTIPSSTSFYPGPLPFIGATSDGGYFLLGTDNLTNNYALLKVGPNLSPSCKSSINKKVWEHQIVMNELEYTLNAIPLGSTTSNSAFTLTPLTPTVTTSCASSTCNTTASFISSAGNVCMGGAISFTNNGQNFSSSQWKVNGISLATTTNFGYTFSNPGSYTITLVVNGACTDSAKHMIFVDSMPNPNFNWTKRLAKHKFQSAKYKSGTFHSWSFSDGVSNNYLDTIYHNYQATGIYTVCLTQTNTCGSAQTCKTVSVNSNYTNSFLWLYKRPFSSVSQSGVSLLQMADGNYFLAGGDGGSGLLNLLDSAGNLKRSTLTSLSGSGYIECTAQSQEEGGALLNGTTSSPYVHLFGKVDSTGTNFYIRTFTVTSTDKLGNCLELKDGRMVFSGGASSQGYLLTTRKNLSVSQYRTFSGLRAITAIRRAPSGCYYVYGTNSINQDPVLTKMDSSFNVIWSKRYDLGTTQYLTSDMRISPSEKIYMTGSYSTAVTPACASFVLAVDSAGNNIFAGNYKRTTGADYGRSIFLDKKGNILVNSYLSFTYGGALIKMDTLGNTPTIQTFSMTTSRFLPTYDNGISVAASTNGGSASAAYTVAAFKLDTSDVIPCKSSTTLIITPLTPTITVIGIGSATSMPIFGGTGGRTPFSASDTLLCSGSLLVTSIKHNERNTSFKIYPNPTSSEVTVISDADEFESVELVNGFGQILFVNESKQSKIIIDMSLYKEGIYFIQIKDKNGTISSKKLIKLN